MRDKIEHEGEGRGRREGVRKMVNARTCACGTGACTYLSRERAWRGGRKSGPDGVDVRREGIDWRVRLWAGPCGRASMCGSAWEHG